MPSRCPPPGRSRSRRRPSRSPLISTANRSLSSTSAARTSTVRISTAALGLGQDRQSLRSCRSAAWRDDRSPAPCRPVLRPRRRERLQLLGHPERPDPSLESRCDDGAHRAEERGVSQERQGVRHGGRRAHVAEAGREAAAHRNPQDDVLCTSRRSASSTSISTSPPSTTSSSATPRKARSRCAWRRTSTRHLRKEKRGRARENGQARQRTGRRAGSKRLGQTVCVGGLLGRARWREGRRRDDGSSRQPPASDVLAFTRLLLARHKDVRSGGSC